MKNIIVILFVFFSFAASAQTHTVSASSTSFSIDGKTYNRGTVRIDTPVGSSGMGIATAATGSVICYMTPYTNYKRANGVAFASRAAFLAFADSFMFYTAGGGITSITPGRGMTRGAITTSGTIELTTAHFDTTIIFTGVTFDADGLATLAIPSGYTKIVGTSYHCSNATPNTSEYFIFTDANIPSSTVLNIYGWTVAGVTPAKQYKITVTIRP